MFKNMSMLKKILAMGVFSILGMLILGVISIQNTNTLSGASKNVVENVLPAVQNISLLGMHHDGLVGVVYKSYYAGLKFNETEKKEMVTEFEDTKKEFYQLLSEVESLHLSDETTLAIHQIKPSLDSYVKSAEDLVHLGVNNKKAEFENNVPQFEASFHRLEKDLERLGNIIRSEGDRTQNFIEEQITYATTTSYGVLILVLIVSIIFGAWVTIDLVSTLKNVVGSIRTQVLGLSEGAEQVQTSASVISKITGSQAAALTETAASIEEIKAMSNKTSENSDKSKAMAEKSASDSEEGERALKKLLNSLEDINQANMGLVDVFSENSHRMKEMSNLIQEIGSQTRVINDIVFQTKLLSLNAAAEAARAGERGKGFSVVAEEVGNLAEMSGQAAKQISNRLAESIKYVDSLISEMEQKLKLKIEINQRTLVESKSVAESCRQSLENSVLVAKQVSDLVSNISDATSEQNTGITEITSAVSMLEQNNQESVNSVTKNFEAVSALKKQSDELRKLSCDLEVLLEGRSSSTKNNGKGNDLDLYKLHKPTNQVEKNNLISNQAS
jgi:methyl-accepting chemotaxis protein